MGKHRKTVPHCLFCGRDIRRGRGVPNKVRPQWCGTKCYKLWERYR